MEDALTQQWWSSHCLSVAVDQTFFARFLTRVPLSVWCTHSEPNVDLQFKKRKEKAYGIAVYFFEVVLVAVDETDHGDQFFFFPLLCWVEFQSEVDQSAIKPSTSRKEVVSCVGSCPPISVHRYVLCYSSNWRESPCLWPCLLDATTSICALLLWSMD